MKPVVLGVLCLILTVCSVSPVNAVAKGWEDKKADIYFLMDSSDSISFVDYWKMMLFAGDMVEGMDIGPDKTRVGVGLFAEEFKEYLPLDNKLSSTGLVQAVSDTIQPEGIGGVGYISRAIQGLRKIGFSPRVVRKGVPQIAVLFTDGESKHHQLTIDNTTLAKKEGIYIFTIGIGRGVDRFELRNIASDPKDDFNFWVPSFSFDSIKEKLMNSMSEVRFLQGDEATCGKKSLADVLFVFDEFSLGIHNSSKVKSFIKSVIVGFSLDSGSIRAGILSKTCHEGDISLGKYLTEEDFLDNIDSQRGPTVRTLLNKARRQGFRPEYGGRSDAKKRIVLFLQGNINYDFSLRDEIRRAKHSRIEIFILPIEVTIRKGALEEMASQESYIIHVPSIQHLKEKSDSFLKAFCGGLN